MGFAVVDSKLEAVKEAGGYLAVRRLADGTVAALGDLMFTRAIYMDCDDIGWSHRFCFSDRDLAVLEFVKLESKDQEPAGFIARRPEIWDKRRRW